jgi:hypothetical protein
MAFPGGTAAKLGSDYEFLWIVHAMVLVLEEQATSITVEVLGVDGAEFRLRTSSQEEYHQAKRQPPGRDGWTVNLLASEGVLSSVKSILREPQTSFHFVSQGSADRTRELSERARGDSSPAALGAKLLGVLVSLQKHWNTDEAGAWSMLRRLHVEGITQDLLRRDVERALRSLLDGDAGLARASLIDMAYQRLNEELSATDLWKWLEDSGFHRRDWAKDTRALPALAKATDRYLASLRGDSIAGETLSREATGRIQDKLVSGTPAILLTGPAGAGKSVVLREVTAALRTSGHPLLAMRVDRLDVTQDLNQIGNQLLGLEAWPSEILGPYAARGGATLIIDQIDAVSTVSGADPQFYHCIAELIDDALARGITVVLGCRLFDLRADSRLAALAKGLGEEAIVDVGVLSSSQVDAVLSRLAVDTGLLNDRQRGLLQIPLHLRLFAESRSAADRTGMDFTNAGDLLSLFWEHKRQRLRERIGPAHGWSEAMRLISSYISSHQTLTIPEHQLDAVRDDVDAMTSENVLLKEGGKYAFFHQSFFDYAFARDFAAGEQALIDLLLTGDQELFRRSQLRQLLGYLRDAERDRYLKDVEVLLGRTDIRFHLKEVAFRFLADLDEPLEEEWQIIAPHLRTAPSGSPADALCRYAWTTLRRSVAWFRLAISNGELKRLLASTDPQVCNEAMTILGAWQREEPDEICDLLEPYLDASEVWGNRIRWIATVGEVGASRRFFELVLEAADRGFVTGGPMGIFTLAYSLPQQNPAWACELLGRYLQHLRGRSTTWTSEGVFGPDSGQGEAAGFVLTAAQGDPPTYLATVLPEVLSLAEAAAATGDLVDGESRRDRIWPYAMAGEPHALQEALLAATADALANIARANPDVLRLVAVTLQGANLHTADWLLAHGYIAAGADFAEDAVRFVLDKPSRLRLGYSDSAMSLTHRLIESASPDCSDDAFRRLEQAFLGYLPDYEKGIAGRHRRGLTELALMSGLARSRLSSRALRRLQELERRFPGPVVREPKGIEFGFVRSPIAESAAPKLSDKQWLRAIEKHAQPRPWSGPDGLVGGPLELSHVLTEQAKEDPARFISLGLMLEASTNPVFFEGILDGLVGQKDLPDPQRERLEELILRCHDLPGRPCSRSIAYLVHSLPDLSWSDDILGVISSCATQDPDPQPEAANDIAGEPGTHRPIVEAGLNSNRGAAARAVAALLWYEPKRWAQLQAAVVSLVSDPSVAVRAAAVGCLLALTRTDPDRSVELFQTLVQDSQEVLGTGEATRFLVANTAAYFHGLQGLVREMMTSTSDDVARSGALVGSLAALEVEEARALLDECLSGREPLRLGAAEVLAANIGTAALRSRCEVGLGRLFNDDSPEVRRAAGRAFDSLKLGDLDSLESVGKLFMDSEAFLEDRYPLVRRLEAEPAPPPLVVCDFCEKCIERGGAMLADIQTHWAAEASQLFSLAINALAITRHEPAIHGRLLSVLDDLLALEVGDRGILAEYDRL